MSKGTPSEQTILYTFSGTGNSLFVAQSIQQSIENSEIRSISKAYRENEITGDADRIGFIFPVYFLDAPGIVKKFLDKIKITGDPYLFAVVTCGGEIGESFKSISRILQKQNRKLDAEFPMILPSNSIILNDKTDTKEEIEERLRKSKIRISEIIEVISSKGVEHYTYKKAPFANRLDSGMGRFFLYRLFNDRLYTFDYDKCVRCGTCVSVCPMNNIEIKDNKLVWHHRCECCAACLHLCPQQAIQNLKTKDVPRYKHPEITIKQLREFIS